MAEIVLEVFLFLAVFGYRANQLNEKESLTISVIYTGLLKM